MPIPRLSDLYSDFLKRFYSSDYIVLLSSIVIQLAFAVLLGHQYDMRIFMATGYLVATGQNPYVAQDLTGVFNNSSFQGMTSIGYPPPWPLMLGLLYRYVYTLTPNLLIYNLVIKIPIIAAVISLAYLVAHILKYMGAETAAIRKAWIFLLLNPFVIYFAAAWGQFDSIVALISLSSLVLLDRHRYIGSAISLALAISIKPTAFPLLPVALVYIWGKSHQRAFIFFAIVFSCLLLFCVAPFIVFGWDPTPIREGWNAHFTVGGGMSFMTFFELLKDTYQMPGQWWLLGLAWIPAMGVSMVAIRRGIDSFKQLISKGAGMTLVFFLTRSWLSEPNVLLLLPLVLILTYSGELNHLALAALWILPLIFTILNASPPQLLFPSFPEAMLRILAQLEHFRTARLISRVLAVIPWQVAGWWMVIACFKHSPTAAIAH